MQKPSNEELKKFIEVFDELSKFEAQTRHNRGVLCFTDRELPIPEVVKVCTWLREESCKKDYEVVGNLIQEYEKKAHDLKIEALSAQNQNDYITMSTCNEEAEIYEKIALDLKNLGGLRTS